MFVIDHKETVSWFNTISSGIHTSLGSYRLNTVWSYLRYPDQLVVVYQYWAGIQCGLTSGIQTSLWSYQYWAGILYSVVFPQVSRPSCGRTSTEQENSVVLPQVSRPACGRTSTEQEYTIQCGLTSGIQTSLWSYQYCSTHRLVVMIWFLRFCKTNLAVLYTTVVNTLLLYKVHSERSQFCYSTYPCTLLWWYSWSLKISWHTPVKGV